MSSVFNPVTTGEIPVFDYVFLYFIVFKMNDNSPWEIQLWLYQNVYSALILPKVEFLPPIYHQRGIYWWGKSEGLVRIFPASLLGQVTTALELPMLGNFWH